MAIKSTSALNFLSGGGEIGKLMREKDWALTAAGDPETWPHSLRILLGTILNSKFPMFIFWGPEHICFYNDAYRPSLGENGKHPEILGQKGEVYWTEIWLIIKPLIDQVLAGGEATWSEDQLIPIYRNGRLEDVYWTFSYSPIPDESGRPAGVLVTCSETTEKVKTFQEIEKNRKNFQNNVMQAPVGIAIFKGEALIAEMANDSYLELVGRSEDEFVGKPLYESLKEVKDTVKPLIDEVIRTGIPYRGNEVEIPINRYGRSDKGYFNFVYQPLHDEEEKINGIMVVVTDVTELTQERRNSEDAETRMQLILNASNVGTWEWILETDEIIYSERYKEIFGFGKDDTKQRSHFEALETLDPAYMEIRDNAIKKAFDTGSLEYEAPLYWKDGSMHWIEVIGKMFYDDAHKPIKLLGTLREITNEKIYKEQLEESERRLRVAAFSSEMGTWEYNPITEKIMWDTSARHLFETDADTPVTMNYFFEKVHLKFHEEIKSKMLKALDPFLEDNYDAEFMINCADATKVKWLHAKGKAFFNEKNEAYLFAGTILDITEKRIALNELEENELRFRILSNAMPQFVWTAAADGNLNYFNEAVYKYSGLTEDEMEKDGWLQIVHPEEKEENINVWLHSVKTGEPFLFEHRFKRYDGLYRWQLSRAIPQVDEKGNIQLWVGTSTDIDDIKKHEEEKNDFIKMANHELKTPVTTIKGYVQLLLKSHGNTDDALLSKSLVTIDKQVTKLTALISTLLDITRIDIGKLPLNNELFGINDLLKETIKDIGAASQSHSIILNEKPDTFIFADKERISQVLLNLFTNAFKYSPLADKVIVDTFTENNTIVVSVQDFGIGIAPEDQENIFERFYRVSGKDEKTFPGFGIGLFIVKEILERHKGKLWVKSEKNKGSIFYFSLPVHQKNNENE